MDAVKARADALIAAPVSAVTVSPRPIRGRDRYHVHSLSGAGARLSSEPTESVALAGECPQCGQPCGGDTSRVNP